VTSAEIQQDLDAPVAEVVAEGDACQFWLGRPEVSQLTAGPLSGAYLQVQVQRFDAGDADELAAWLETYATEAAGGGPVEGLGDHAYFEPTTQVYGSGSPSGLLIVRSGTVLASMAFNPELAGARAVTGDLQSRLTAVAQRILARV
jgi:hypothetical protein